METGTIVGVGRGVAAGTGNMVEANTGGFVTSIEGEDVGTGVHAVKVTTIAHNINALKVNVLTTNSSTWIDGSQDNLSKVRKIGSLREVPGAERPESRS